MQPNHIFIVRHGESASNADKKVHAKVPNYLIPLTEKGNKEAYEAGVNLLNKFKKNPEKYVTQVLKHDQSYFVTNGDGKVVRYINSEKKLSVATYCSPFKRTRQTYLGIKTALAALNDIIALEYEDPRLREQEYGHLRGPKEDEKIEKEREAYGKFYFRIPDGESGADVYDRQKSFLGTLFRDFEKKEFPNVALIVGHGFQLRVFLMAFLHWTVEEFEAKRNIKNCEILHLELQSDGKYKLITPLEDESR